MNVDLQYLLFNFFRDHGGLLIWIWGWEGIKKTMATSGHTFWPSFPTLEVALIIASDGLWRFGANFFGVDW